MMEMIRRLIMKRLQKKRTIAVKWEGVICLKIATRLEELDDNSRGSVRHSMQEMVNMSER